jgi:hypothetical protein
VKLLGLVDDTVATSGADDDDDVVNVTPISSN